MGVKAGPLSCRPPLSVMYSHSQRGICPAAPLTLPSRELSRACVYLPLFVLRSPRPCRENTSKGEEGRGSHAVRCGAQTTSSDPRRNQTSVSKSTMSERRAGCKQTAALSQPVTCEEALRFPQRWRGGTRDDIAKSPHKDWQEHLVKEAFIITLTPGAQYNACYE